MKTMQQLLTPAMIFLAAAAVLAGEPESKQLPKVDAIYNEIMSSLNPEVKASIDSTIASGERQATVGKGIDTTRKAKESLHQAIDQKNKHLEELPEDLRKQVEKAMKEMEQRQSERKLEFKEMKRGQ
jgi:hypothetical protein